jgi:hypothetical protein
MDLNCSAVRRRGRDPLIHVDSRLLMDKETARDVHALLMSAAGAIDAAIAAAQSGMQDSELVDFACRYSAVGPT